MVKVLQFLLLASGIFLAAAAVIPASDPSTQLDDASARSERSANLSHIAGSARNIRMYIKNRYLQILSDGTVNGTGDDLSDFTILQRTSVHIGQVKIQGVATCMYLCLNNCGLLYASKNYTDDCVFNEMIESHNYNTYSSVKYSNNRSTMYFALNKKGVSRRVRVKAGTPLGKLSTYTRVLTTFVPPSLVGKLASKLMGPSIHGLRHHHLCPPVPPHKIIQTTDVERCRKRKKRRKKRRCREGEEESEDCHKVKTPEDAVPPLARKRVPQRGRKCEEGEEKGKCQKKLHRKRKSRQENKRLLRHLHHNIRPRVDLSNQRSEEEEEDEDIDDGEAVTMTTLADEDYALNTSSYTTDVLLLDTNDK